MNDASSMRNSNFNANLPTVVIAHGWLVVQETDFDPVIRDAILSRSDTNVIVLDWRRLAISSYATAANGTPAVGRGLGQFLNFLIAVTGARSDNIHIVGFSLGAHLAGNAGRELGGRVARVTALDPAGPLWTAHPARVRPGDAVYVEAIHTNGGVYGIGINVANADFYPNGGMFMPGCDTNVCSHNKAWRYFAATVTHNHIVARECSSSLEVTFDTCRGRSIRMGNVDMTKFALGMYRVNTGPNFPY